MMRMSEYNENEQSLQEFNEIYADFGNSTNENIEETTYSAAEFREIALEILKQIYDE